MSFRPNEPARGRRGGGGQNSHWPHPQQSQNMEYGGYASPMYNGFPSAHRTAESYFNEMHGHGFASSQNRPTWHQPSEYTYPSTPVRLYKKPRVETKEFSEGSSKRQTIHIQNQPNQAPNTLNRGDQMSVRSLEQQIKIEEPCEKSNHYIQDVLRVTNSENILSESSNQVIKIEDIPVNNSSPEIRRHLNQNDVIDLTNDDDDKEENTMERENKENTSVHNIVCEPNNETSKNKTTAANTINIVRSQAVPTLVLRKSNGNSADWSVQRPTASNMASTVALESSTTDVNPNIIENVDLKSNNPIPIVSSSATLNDSSLKAQDQIRIFAASRKEVTVMEDTTPARNEATMEPTPRSSLDTLQKKIKPGPKSSKPPSYIGENVQNGSAPTQQSGVESNGEEDDSSQVVNGNPVTATSADISDGVNDEDNTGVGENSDFDDLVHTLNKVTNPSCKRKDKDSEVFVSISKKARPILESDGENEIDDDDDDDVIIISVSESELDAENPLTSTSKKSYTLNEKSKSTHTNPASETISSELNISKYHKTTSAKRRRDGDKKSAHKSVIPKPEHKTHKSLSKSNLPSQQEGKKRHIINNSRKLVVLLKRLSPHEISKFSAPKNVVEKSLYQKDVLHQVKYFISLVEQLSANNGRIFLDINVDSKTMQHEDLCNQLFYYSNMLDYALVQVKYLVSEQSKITLKSLFNPELDIRKMYKSFLDFRKISNNKLNHFTIFTNMQLAVENLKSNNVEVKHENGRYYLSVQEGHELEQKFVKCLTLYNLAEVLNQCIVHRKQKNFNTELIKKYHLALVKERVFKIHNSKNSKGKPVHEAKFHYDFVRCTALSDAAKELRRHLTDLMRCEPQISMGFVLVDHFGKDVNLDPNPVLIDVKEISEALASKDQEKLSSLKDELKMIVGHVLEKIQNNVFGFSREFIQGENLPGNLKQLRRQLNLQCEHHSINFIKFCRDYTLHIDDFCYDYLVYRLPIENGKKLFQEFFHIFNFANIQQHIRLNKNIEKINDKACLNAVQKEILAGLRADNLGKETFDSILKVVSKNEIIRASYKQPQPKNNIEFHENVINIFKNKLPTCGIVLCLTKSIALTNVILKQLSARMGYREDEECLFTTSKVLLEKTSDVLNAFADKSTHLLVVQWIKPMEKDTALDVFPKLLNAVYNESADNHSMKSVIIVVCKKDYPSDLDVKFSAKITDREHLFQLAESSRVKILEAENVFLQNRQFSLINSNLIADEYVHILLESTEILSKLLTGRLSIGKSLVKPNGYKESLFKMHIKQCIIINPAVFHEKIDDVFVIRDIDRKDMHKFLPARQKILAPNNVPASMRINGRFILLGFTVPPSFFDDYVEKNQDRDVHLLRFASGSFIWENTSGNNVNLLRNRLDNTDDLLKDQKTEDVVGGGPKIIIICGASGLGKSVCLYNLARETKNLYKVESLDAHWSMQVNLDKARLSKWVKKNINVALEKGFVAEFLGDYLRLDQVQSKILAMIFDDQIKIKLSLFFDNFEELPPSHRNFVIKLLQELQVSYCDKIYVTSSPNTRSELEDALAVFSYTLEFSEMEKINLLQTFWSKSFGEIDFSNEAGYLISHYSETESDLTTTPLHLQMLAEMHKPSDEEYIPIESLVELYKVYIKHRGVKDIKSACIYSLHKILNKDQLEMLKIDNTYDSVLPDDLRHCTFFEYLAAQWLGRHNQSLSDSKFISLLDSVSPLFLKTYLSELIASEDVAQVVVDFAANGHLNYFKSILPHWKDGKLSLATIIRKNSNCLQSIKFLLDHYNDTKDDIMLHGEFKKKEYAECNVVKYVNKRDKVKKETPLQVAARIKNVPIACELLLKGANIDKIDEEFVMKIAQYIADEMCKSAGSEWLHPIAEKLFKLEPNAVKHLDKTKEYPRLLSYFYSHGRVELVNQLLKNNLCERHDILLAKVDNKTSLDLVNDSRALNDDERLEMTKYIVGNVGEDLERKNRYYLANVLKASAECNHERTFSYFIGKYPDKHMGFLTSAMKSNRRDVIRFLMRKTDRMIYPDENTALHKAVALGVSLTTIQFLVNKGGIDNKNKFGETALCIAFKEGQDLQLIDYLIKKEADLFTLDELGLYPWCHAILEESKYTSEEQRYIIKYLQDVQDRKLRAPETEQMISCESDPKRKEVARKLKFFQRPLTSTALEMHVALLSNNDNYIKFLIRHGADVNHESEGQMPLHIAIDLRKYKLATMLLDHGAIFNAENKSKKTPLQLLMANGDDSEESKEIKDLLKIAKKLFEADDKFPSQIPRHLINCRDKQGQTLLHVAAKSGNLKVVKNIIKQSKEYCIKYKDFPAIDVNAKNAKTQTPLYLVKRDNVDVAKELLVNGAISERGTPLRHEAKALIQAVTDKDMNQVKELVKKNACLVNAKDKFGKSCLHYAAIFDCIEIMKILLAVQVSDVDAVDSNLQTPFHYAVEKDHIECTVLLLKAGASYDMRNVNGSRPFDLADRSNESLKLVLKIHQMFGDLKSDEPRILDNENPDALIEYLTELERMWHISKDVVVNVVDSRKNTLLHIATKYDFCSVVQNLLRHGAMYNSKNRENKSPESMAISTKQIFRNVRQIFHDKTTSLWTNFDPEFVINLRNNNGSTLLHECAEFGQKEQVRWLIENGADVEATNSRGTKISCDKKKYPELYELLFQD